MAAPTARKTPAATRKAPAATREAPATTPDAGAPSPIVVDLGKTRRKRVKQLLRGEGRVLSEVQDCIEELRNQGAIEGPIQPVIVVVRPRERESSFSMLPFKL